MTTIEREAVPTRRRRPQRVDADHPHYKWWALSCTSVGMLLATVNSGTLIIALPDLERALHTSLLTLVWVILSYMIASTVLVVTAGRLSDLFGRKKAYVAGFLVFSAASLGAGFAGDGTELILWRIAQGVGGAFLFANSAALVTDAFPARQLGLAMGTNTMVAAVGLVLGPVLGGAAGDDLLALGLLVQRPARPRRERSGPPSSCASSRGPTPCAGSTSPARIVFVTGLTGLVLGISRGGLTSWTDPSWSSGWSSASSCCRCSC